MTSAETITIRFAADADSAPLDWLAERDSRQRPSDDFLIVEVGGQARAAIGVRTGAILADPFQPTAELVEILRRQAATLDKGSGNERQPRTRFRVTAPASAR